MNEKDQGKTDKPILKILQGSKAERMPIWLMRQAGRYLPEYRKLRARAGNFLDLCLTPEWASEITLQPIRRFDLDAAILFADILLIPYALGQKLEFHEGKGPALQKIVDEKDFARLKLDISKLEPVFETLALVKSRLSAETGLIGFCGAPWTVACYMIDGNSAANFARARQWATEKPEMLEKLTDLLIDASEAYLGRQIEAGAEILQIFDSWAGLLSGSLFDRFVIEPTSRLVSRLRKKYPQVPIIGFPREAGAGYESYAQKTGIDAMSIDQNVSLDRARRLQEIKTLQGNLDPALLVAGGAAMKNAAVQIMRQLGPNHIMNLGHGVLPETPPEHVAELVSIVRSYRFDKV